MSIPDPTAVAVTLLTELDYCIVFELASCDRRTARELAEEFGMAEEEVTCAAMALVRAGYLAYDGAYRLADVPEGE